MKNNSLLNHLKNILLLPVNVTIVIPYILHNFIWKAKIANYSTLIILVGVVFILLGILLLLYTVFLFKTKGEGTLAPWNPTQKLVIKGPYRYMRNPMITGVVLILIGESLVFNSKIILIWAIIFFIVNNAYFLLVEEPKLKKQFRNPYIEYLKHVPRWIPKLKPYKPE